MTRAEFGHRERQIKLKVVNARRRASKVKKMARSDAVRLTGSVNPIDAKDVPVSRPAGGNPREVLFMSPAVETTKALLGSIHVVMVWIGCGGFEPPTSWSRTLGKPILQAFAAVCKSPIHSSFLHFPNDFQGFRLALSCIGLPSLDARKGQEKGKVGSGCSISGLLVGSGLGISLRVGQAKFERVLRQPALDKPDGSSAAWH